MTIVCIDGTKRIKHIVEYAAQYGIRTQSQAGAGGSRRILFLLANEEIGCANGIRQAELWLKGFVAGKAAARVSVDDELYVGL